MPDQSPEAVQLVAFELLQDKVVEPPLATDAGLAERLNVGVGKTVTFTVSLVDPPLPVQFKLYVLFAVIELRA